MALSAKESKIVLALGSSSFNNAILKHEACILAVRKAYGDKADQGELARAIVDAVTVKDRIEVGRFLRKWGLNVTIDGKTVTVGNIRDPKAQAKHVSGVAADIAYWQLVDAHIKAKPAPKAPTGTVEEQAKEAVAALVKRMKDSKTNPLGPEVAGMINNMLQVKTVEVEVTQPSTFVTKEGHVYELDADEEEAMLNWLLGRATAKAQLKLAA